MFSHLIDKFVCIIYNHFGKKLFQYIHNAKEFELFFGIAEVFEPSLSMQIVYKKYQTTILYVVPHNFLCLESRNQLCQPPAAIRHPQYVILHPSLLTPSEKPRKYAKWFHNFPFHSIAPYLTALHSSRFEFSFTEILLVASKLFVSVVGCQLAASARVLERNPIVWYAGKHTIKEKIYHY